MLRVHFAFLRSSLARRYGPTTNTWRGVSMPSTLRGRGSSMNFELRIAKPVKRPFALTPETP